MSGTRASSKVMIWNGLQGYWAYGIRFDHNNNLISETKPKLFIDYTKKEIRNIIRAELKGESSNV